VWNAICRTTPSFCFLQKFELFAKSSIWYTPHKERSGVFCEKGGLFMEVMHNEHELEELHTVTPADWIIVPQMTMPVASFFA
jgi:hypothetical protein